MPTIEIVDYRANESVRLCSFMPKSSESALLRVIDLLCAHIRKARNHPHQSSHPSDWRNHSAPSTCDDIHQTSPAATALICIIMHTWKNAMEPTNT